MQRHLISTRFRLSMTAVLLAAVPAVFGAEAEPTAKPAWEDRPLPAWKPAVAADVVKLEGGAEIQWKPLPFEFVAGESVRYIDYDNGDDANSGQSREQAWKHHPWDASAAGNAKAAKGVHTYVFKRGVVYQGSLTARESGSADEPVRLTSDPSWGEGAATITGSQVITGGWEKVSADQAAAAGFPKESQGKLWAVDVEGDFVPWALWLRTAEGQRQRIPIARWPNWKAEHEYNIFTQWLRVEEVEKGFPRTTIFAPKVLNDPDPKAYEGATVWMDHANTSGEFSIIGPFPSRAIGYQPDTGRLLIEITHPRRHPNKNAPFYLENKASFLDEAGEWYFARADEQARRLYIRLPDDADPKQATVELARHPVLIDINNQQHIEVSGLTLTAGNAQDLNAAPRAGDWERPEYFTQMAAVRLSNNARHIRLHHLDIRDTAGTGVVNFVSEENTALRDIEIADSRFENIDNEAVKFTSRSAPLKSPATEVTDIRILRNRLNEIGQRASSDQGGRGIDINGLAVGQIAGNVINRTGGQGINVVGARMATDVPLVRIQIDRNQVKDTLLQKQDFGGIEFWGLGPAYVYNNISINPVGFVAHRNVYHKNEAFYFDHGAKGYLFNNIGWSDSRDDAHRGILADQFFKEVRNRWNQAFHNTSYNFRNHYNHEGVHGDQQHYLGNLAIKTTGGFTGFWRLDEAAEIAFSRNLIAGGYTNIYGRWKGAAYRTIEQMQQHVAGLTNNLATDIGWVTDDMPVVDPEKHDFRLTDNSAAIDRGVKVFVPWSLYGTVGEWHFRLHPKDPNTVMAYDVYPQPFHLHHEGFRMGTSVPENQLAGTGFTAEHYEPGVLEDWVPGAVAFDGNRQFALAQDTLVKDFSVTRDKTTVEVAGEDRKTVRMADNSFLIEAVFRIESGKTTGNIAGKLDAAAGYALGLDDQGRLVMRLRTGGQEVTQASAVAVNDGRWHHAIAEVDRAAGKITIYVDGAAVNGSTTGAMPAAGASLDNAANFVVGEGFVGALDYLRVSRGTLADAQTTIDELMAWQFNGPALHDFVDRPPTGGIRDIGAIEHPTISGRQPINYTPPTTTADAEAQPGSPDELKTGADRIVQALGWGTVSVPKEAKIGQTIDIQVVFGTESIEKPQKLCIDMHARSGGKRTPGFGRPKAIDITPGSTKPYTVTWKVRESENLDGVTAVIYASADGSWSEKTLSAEATIAIVAGDGAAAADAPAQSVIEGPAKTQTFDWGTIMVPESVSVGQKLPVVVTFKDDAIKQKGDLRIDLHWWKGKERAGVLGGARHPNVSSGETVVKEITVPRKEGITAIAAIVYVAPGGEYSKKFLGGELGGITVKPAAGAAEGATPPASVEPAKPAAEAKPQPSAPAAAAGDVVVKETDWGTITVTKDPKVGEELVVTITLKEGVVTEATTLTADLHWWKGKQRAGALGKIGQKKIKAGETGPVTFKKSVPDKEGITALAAVVSLSPDGSWASKTHSAEAGTNVKKD